MNFASRKTTRRPGLLRVSSYRAGFLNRALDGACDVSAADLVSDVLQEFCGAQWIAGGVAVGVVGNGEYLSELGDGRGIDIVTSHHSDHWCRRGTQRHRDG